MSECTFRTFLSLTPTRARTRKVMEPNVQYVHRTPQTAENQRSRGTSMDHAAPAMKCTACSRTIGKRAGHNLTDDGRLLCTRCLSDATLHARYYPRCPQRWHDMHDHLRHVGGTRAGTAAALGLWPERVTA